MKMALVYHSFALYRKPVLQELVRRLGSDLILVSSDGSDAGSVASIGPAQCEAWREQWRLVSNRWWLGQRLLWQSGLFRATRDARVIVALGSVQFVSTWVLLAVARLRRQKVFLWTHGLYGNESALKKAFRCVFYRMADGLLVYGQYAARLLSESGIPESRVRVIYNSLDTASQHALYQSRHVETLRAFRQSLFNNDHPVLAFIGRLTPEKKLHQLLEAAHLLQARGRPVNCLFIGAGTEQASLEGLALEWRITAHFAGEMYDEASISRYLMVADAVVSPGNVGLTAMHALAYGAPVFTHSNFTQQGPEFEAIRDGQTGAFFRQNDVGDLALKLEQWLAEHPVRSAASEAACREVILSHYNPEYQADVIERVLT